MRNVKEHITQYNVMQYCTPGQRHIAGYLKALCYCMTEVVPKQNSMHVYCDGSVSGEGRVTHGRLLWEYDEYEQR